MNGAESLLQTAVSAGIDICFANPGTTELPLVRALDSVKGIKSVLCLFEGVVTGAADGYSRMSEKPALTLLHLGPGFANGIAYLHDARRARSSIVNLIGDHATWHLAADAPLTSDIVSLAKPVSSWLRTSDSSQGLSRDMAEAISAAARKPGQISTLIVPHDHQLGPAGEPAKPLPTAAPTRVEDKAISDAASFLKAEGRTAIFLGGAALRERGLKFAARIAALTGCSLICETFPTRWDRGQGIPQLDRLPYFPQQAIAALSGFKNIILAGPRSPVSFFGYPGVPSYFISPESAVHTLATVEDDVISALENLCDYLKAPQVAINARPTLPAPESGPLTIESLGLVLASQLPEDCVVMDEGNTSGLPFSLAANNSPRHTVLTQPGGAIGLGPPCATGAGLASPGRRVINLQADGSALYTLQALWTQAREQLPVTTIICNNGGYRILGLELKMAGVEQLGEHAAGLISIAQPSVDWVNLAQGFGVPAVRVDSVESFRKALSDSLQESGPRLIEALLN